MSRKFTFSHRISFFFTLTLFSYLSILLVGCFPQQEGSFHVKLRLSKFPESLNPATLSSLEAAQLTPLLFSPLLKIDASGELQPYLVKSLPKVSPENKNQFEYTLRPEARWDDGRSITSSDVLFSIKVFRSPIFDNFRARHYHRSISAIEILSEEKFLLTIDDFVLDAVRLSGDMIVLPQHQLDPDNLLEKYSLEEMLSMDVEKPGNELIQAFSKNFNQQTLLTTNDTHGSGPYKIQTLENDQLIRLERKSDWWGDAAKVADILYANPEWITYYVIPEANMALRTLLNGQIDVMSNIPAADFSRLRNDPAILPAFHFENPASYRFVFMGMNTRRPWLADTNFRWALSQLVDKETVVKIAQGGEGIPTLGPVNPADTHLYHPTLQANNYAPDSAKIYLEQVLDGMPTFELKYNAASVEYEKIALYFKSQAEKSGVKIRLVPLELTRLRNDLRQHDFDLMLYSFVGSRFATDFSVLFGTSSAAVNGLNFTGFGDAASDAMIDAINNAPTWEKRANEMHAFQEVLHAAQPAIFLYFENNRIMINKKYDPGTVSSIPPNFEVEAFLQQN